MRGAVAPGGLVRYQLLALLTDTEGLELPQEGEGTLTEADPERENNEPDLLAPIRAAGEEELVGEGYMGHSFAFDEARQMSLRVFGAEVGLMRLGRPFIIGEWTRYP